MRSAYVCHRCLTDEHHKHRNLKGLFLLIKSREIMMTSRLFLHKCAINLLCYPHLTLGTKANVNVVIHCRYQKPLEQTSAIHTKF